MPITPLPSLDRTATTFKEDVDVFFATELPQFSVEAESARDQVNTNAIISAEQMALATAQALTASNAATSASSAALSAGAVVWVSGLTYTAGETRYSPLDFMTYRRKTTGAGTTDPSLDSSNWANFVTGFATLSGAETFTNKTVSAFRYLDRTVTNATATGTVTLDLSQGSTFDLTLSGNTTLALSNVPVLTNETLNIFISVTQGTTAYSLTWFGGITWITAGSIAPAAPAANKINEYIITTKAPGVYKGRKGAST